MSWLKSLPSNSRLFEVFQAFPETARPLIEYHEALMRGPSPFTVGERELIAAYVSGLNSCGFCHSIHAQTAAAFGIDIQLLHALLTDHESVPVSASLRPVLSFVKKLTLFPGRMIPADAETVFATGWDDRALHDAAANLWPLQSDEPLSKWPVYPSRRRQHGTGEYRTYEVLRETA